MKSVINILSGIGVLIAVYLVLSQGNTVTKLANSLMSNTVAGIKTLQGR